MASAGQTRDNIRPKLGTKIKLICREKSHEDLRRSRTHFLASFPGWLRGNRQDRPTVTAQPNSVFVGADGKFEANPDTAVMQFNISAQEATSREAYDRASKSAEQVRQILRSNGIEPKSAEIGYFSLSRFTTTRLPSASWWDTA